MILGPNDFVYMNAGGCETTDKIACRRSSAAPGISVGPRWS